jgi:hypothetical protein
MSAEGASRRFPGAGCPTHSRFSNEWESRSQRRPFRSPTIIEVRPCGKARGLGVSSFRAYACGEEGQVRINCQERPLKIPLIRKPRMSGAPGAGIPRCVTRITDKLFMQGHNARLLGAKTEIPVKARRRVTIYLTGALNAPPMARIRPVRSVHEINHKLAPDPRAPCIMSGTSCGSPPESAICSVETGTGGSRSFSQLKRSTPAIFVASIARKAINSVTS